MKMKTDDEKYGGATADEVIDSMQEEIGRLQAECDGAGRVIASLIVERDAARQEAAAVREEAREMGELLVEYHDELRDAQWGTEWECPSCRRVAKLGHYKECSIGDLLARWPEVKP